MKEQLFFILAMVVSGIPAMYFSIKHQWHIKVWKRVLKDKKMDGNVWSSGNLLAVFIWLIVSVLIQLLTQLIFEALGVTGAYGRIPVGIAFGLCLAFMPLLKTEQ